MGLVMLNRGEAGTSDQHRPRGDGPAEDEDNWLFTQEGQQLLCPWKNRNLVGQIFWFKKKKRIQASLFLSKISNC